MPCEICSWLTSWTISELCLTPWLGPCPSPSVTAWTFCDCHTLFLTKPNHLSWICSKIPSFFWTFASYFTQFLHFGSLVDRRAGHFSLCLLVWLQKWRCFSRIRACSVPLPLECPPLLYFPVLWISAAASLLMGVPLFSMSPQICGDEPFSRWDIDLEVAVLFWCLLPLSFLTGGSIPRFVSCLVLSPFKWANFSSQIFIERGRMDVNGTLKQGELCRHASWNVSGHFGVLDTPRTGDPTSKISPPVPTVNHASQ